MTSQYNELSGQSVERLQALADGVFAVAMTLLVLDLRLPEQEATDSQALWDQLRLTSVPSVRGRDCTTISSSTS